MRPDLLVAGGGPVGLGVAIAAALAGLEAVVVEPRPGTVDKACGESLTPAALAALAGWGVEPAGMPIAGFRYTDEARAAEHRLRGGAGRGVRRTVLHDALRSRAADLGVEVRRGVVEGIEQDARGIRAAGVAARYLVGADGLHSRVRREAGLAARPALRRRYGVRRHYPVAPWTDLVEVHWLRGAEVYVTPVGPDTVGVAVLGGKGVDFGAALAACPALERRLRGVAPGPLRGAGPLRQRTAARTAGRVALAGDAAGYVDALTGEGLAVGFASADAVVAAVAAGDLRSYEAAWRRATRASRLLTAAVAGLAASPVRPAIVPFATAVPGAFAAAVETLATAAGPVRASVGTGRMPP
jgi:flavin-dependent dehydrogenase